MSGRLQRALRGAAGAAPGAGAAKPDPIFGARPRAELEFLPAALEIIETPAPPLPRATILAITALLVAAIAWAWLGWVDVISTSNGRLVPAGGGKVIQPLETATVSAIHAYDGEQVTKGQVLAELEPAEPLADVDRLKGQLAAAQLEVARLETVALNRRFTAPAGADPSLALVAEREASAQSGETAAKVAGLERQMQQHQAELDGARAEAERLRSLLALADQRSQMYRNLEAKGYGSRLQMLDAEEKQQDIAHSLDVQEHRVPELEATIAATARERDAAAAESAKTDLAALADARVKSASLADELAKAEAELNDRTLRAPVDGVVQELVIHTVGGVVQPGQTLMRIAPAGAHLIVEARLANREVGFVRAGMAAEVKVETFPFTRYGVIPARVLTVSQDALAATPPPTGQAGASPAAAAADAEPQYLVRLALSRDAVKVDGRMVPLEAGMAVTAEIKTGRRRIISYVLSPFARSVSEAGRER